ncbi:MAG TPA: hypothetical protein VGA64_03005, partial [Candidatus Polarisedimenticolia bacterium]
MNALFAPGAKRYRLLVAFGVAILLASPVMLIWASREQPKVPVSFMEELTRSQARLHATAEFPAGHERPVELSPFGDKFKEPRLAKDPSGLLLTPLGHLRPQDPEALLRDLPANLRHQANELIKTDRGKATEGLNLVMLDRKAVAADGID